MIAAMTPGTAYGMKAATRNIDLNFSSGESSSSAMISAANSITGTCTIPNSPMRPMLDQNSLFWNACTYCWKPPNVVYDVPYWPPVRRTTWKLCQIA